MRVAGNLVDGAEARAVVAGYCFGERTVRAQLPDGDTAPSMSEPQAPRWAYRTYDCVPGSSTTDLEAHDVLVIGGLNGRPDAEIVGSVVAVTPAISQKLRRIADAPAFWELPLEGLDEGARSDDGAVIDIYRAWSVLMSVERVDVATTHKILHHKLPRHFPLLDRRTVVAFPRGLAWRAIHQEVTDPEFEDLEAWFDDLRFNFEATVPLSRLRLHDILLWSRIVGQWASARAAGPASA
jgi:hypothetical protein